MNDTHAGSLVIRGSNIKSLDCFVYLAEVNAGANLFDHVGGSYAVALYGMPMMMSRCS